MLIRIAFQVLSQELLNLKFVSVCSKSTPKKFHDGIFSERKFLDIPILVTFAGEKRRYPKIEVKRGMKRHDEEEMDRGGRRGREEREIEPEPTRYISTV